jgi:hypothetical protein
VCDLGIHLDYKILISISYFTASQNGPTRQTDEIGACEGFAYLQQNWFYLLTATVMGLIRVHSF